MGGFEMFCVTMISLLFGLLLVFGGYRLFLLLLPIWGFFFGFGLGAQSMTMLFGEAFLGTVTGWVVGFFVGALMAVLSYLFYFVAVGVVAASIGYGIGIAIMGWIGSGASFINWVVGLVLAIALVVLTYMFNLQKYVIIIGTTLLGAGLIVATFLVGPEQIDLVRLAENPLGTLLANHWFYTLIFLTLLVAGIIVQSRINKSYTIAEYNRWDDIDQVAI